MRSAVRTLVSDAWVLPIAAAAAIAYAAVRFLTSLVDVLFDLAVRSQAAQAYTGTRSVDAELFRFLSEEPMMVTIGSRVLFLQPLLENAVVLLVTIAAAALALHLTERARPVDVDS